jgi:chemotaxis family two-component system response regulator PixG
MTHQELTVSKNLLKEFQICTQLQYNGHLKIKSSKGQQWNFYYRLGRIVWATGGKHPFRRWRRHISQNCPHIDLDKLRFRPEDLSIDYWDYRLLEILYKRQKIQRDQIHAIVENTIAELFFDLAHEADFTPVTCERNQDVILDTPMSYTSADISLQHIQGSWQTWSEAGLANFSPDLAPVIRKPEQLQQLVSPSVYNNFVNFINGKYTLRDLAVKMKQSLLLVSRSLLPYVLKGIIELVEAPDLPLLTNEVKNHPTTTPPKNPKSPLVACVDDSPQVCKMLEEIITSNGMRFIKIQDAVQALPTLIQEKPDLIFLDLIMPVASGYEICTQLRRISSFADIPIIILTGNDGLLDRVRCKVVGSTDFLTKPVVADRVISITRKYLPVKTPSKPKNIPSSVANRVSNLEVCH